MKKSHKPEMPWEPWDGKYIGNMWGWKFSFISLALLLTLLLLAGYKYTTLSPEEQERMFQPTPETTIERED